MTDTETTNVDTTDTRAVCKLLYTPVEAARALGIGRSTIYLLLADGTIPSVRIGASRRIRARDLGAFTEALPDQGGTHPGRRMEETRSPRPVGAAASRLHPHRG